MKTLSANEKSLARKFYRAIGTPLALALDKAVSEEAWGTIATCKVDPKDYTSSQQYFLDAAAASLLRKYSTLPLTSNRKAHAIANWVKGERDCYRTNERLAPYLEGCTHPDWDEAVAGHLAELRKRISVLLGRCPAMDHLQPRFGPGATFSDKANRSTVADKMQQHASITHSAVWFLLDWVGTSWGREAIKRGVNPFPVRGNRFTTAPKDAIKDRPIAAEPSINIFYQLALGREVRHRLKKHGIDLNVAADLHRQVACEASISGSYATLDLSNASDTVAYNLVKLLLPPDWFTLFDELRSGFTRMSSEDSFLVLGREATGKGDHWVRLEKFSSMGNGFTFELETLLFLIIADYAADQAATDGGYERLTTRVFGDDILCDSRGVENVVALLRFLGFTLNEEKSFHNGAFRESCGGDFWGGRPVRPYFLKDPLDEPQRLIAFANGIRQLGQDLFGGLGPLAGVWFSIQDQLPSRIRWCRGPQSLGDIVIHDDEVNWSWTSRSRTKLYAYTPVRYHEVPLEDYAPGVVHACGLYGLTVSSGFLIPRDAVSGYGFRKVYPKRCDWVPEPRITGTVHEALSVHESPLGPTYSSKTIVRRARTNV